MSIATSMGPRYAGAPAVPGYALGEFLGRGSSAVVWAGTSAATGELVAVKVFAGDRPSARRGQVLAATERELTLSRRFKTAHLVRARESLELDDGRVALVLDLADAGSLRDVVTIRGALPLGEVVTTVTPLATALAELAEAGVVHGDVAPANVLFTGEGRPVLADLSAAWLVDDGWPETVVGTTGFIAPEVIAGRPPTPSSDVWSLGALLWYSRTGGGTPPGWVGDLHWGHAPAEPAIGGGTTQDVSEAVGPELRPLVLRMLADDPDARPTAAEAALAIYRLATPEPVVLVGRHPDPAAAVTNRIRREAAETRTRAQLRAHQRAQERAERHGGGRGRGPSRFVRWPRRRRAEAVERREVGERDTPSTGTPSVWGRVAAMLVAGLVLAAGMFGLLAVSGTARETPIERVASGVAPGSVTPSEASSTASGPMTAETPQVPQATSTGMTTAPATTTTGASTASTAASTASTAASTASTTASPVSTDLSDPTVVLQGLADLRAAALSTADPVALVGAEPEGTAAYLADAATVARLRDQRQRYRDLSFTVREAQVVSRDGNIAIVRATVDRAACTVEGEDGSTQSLAAAPGEPLRYTLRLADGAWRLTDVGTG